MNVDVFLLFLFSKVKFPKNCLEVQKWKGSHILGIFKINPVGKDAFDVYCDGEWAVIQRRMDGSINFNRDWVAYKDGFGNLSGEFWLGNEHLHLLTKTPSILHVEMESFSGKKAYALYNLFQIGSSAEKYRLKVDNYLSTAGDALQSLNGAVFSTIYTGFDTKLQQSCANVLTSAWWYQKCDTLEKTSVDLNGVYPARILWYEWSQSNTIKSVTMKIKPKQGM